MVSKPKSKAKTSTKVAITATVIEPSHKHLYDPVSFKRLADSVQARFNIASLKPLFVSSITGDQLWSRYLQSFPKEIRQSHDCRACRKFITTAGRLITIDPVTGDRSSALWNEKDCKVSHQTQEYKDGFAAMRALIESAPVEGVFVTSESVLGTPKTEDWLHFSVTLNANIVSKDKLRTPHQIMAAKLEDYRNVCHAISEIREDHIRKAVTLLESGNLVRSEKFLNPAKWLLDVAETLLQDDIHHFNANAKVWHRVATAPAGFCHPRSGVLGSLLEDLRSGLDLDTVKRRFMAKLDPMEYQRPKAAPSEQTINRAEEIFAKLGLGLSLRRRFATVDDLKLIWREKVQPKSTNVGLFADVRVHSTPKQPAPVTGGNVTWAKFCRTVLPGATKIEVSVAQHIQSHFVGFTTATFPEAPPILQWDQDTARYPVAWYMYANGSSPESWGIGAGWLEVSAVTPKPNMVDSLCPHLGDGAILIVKGMRENAQRAREMGIVLFPETLRSELHEVRSVIERASKVESMDGSPVGSAAGILVGSNIGESNCPTKFIDVRVTSDTGVTLYRIDRWE